jgi:hypothetical protein
LTTRTNGRWRSHHGELLLLWLELPLLALRFHREAMLEILLWGRLQLLLGLPLCCTYECILLVLGCRLAI